MHRFAAAVVLCGSLIAVSFADAPKWEPPPTPKGWKAVVSNDGLYRFVVPLKSARSGTRDRSITINRVKVQAQVNYVILKDGTTLAVEAVKLTGPGMQGVTVADVTESILNIQRDDGFAISEPKDVTVGDIKAREYRLTNDKISRRLYLFAAKPRLFALDVTSNDPAHLDTETANIFLQSLVLVPPDVVKAQAKEKAAKDEQAGKANQEKYGVKWTKDLKEMIPPEAPAIGVIRGREFKPDTVTLSGGRLVFRQGEKGVFADIEVSLSLFLSGESVENKSYEIPVANFNPPQSPHIRLATMAAGAKILKSEAFVSKYALKLTFGSKDADGSIPGTIYLCTSDKSFLAGAFTAKSK